jgi:hypothetical protein
MYGIELNQGNTKIFDAHKYSRSLFFQNTKNMP